MFSPTLKKKFLWHPGYESSNFPQNLTNARVLFSTSIDHCLDHFESLEFAQAQLREKSHFTSLFSSQSAVFALCLVSVKWSIASLMSSKLEPVIWLRVLVTLAYMKGRTDVHDVMAIKPNFLTSMGYHIS